MSPMSTPMDNELKEENTRLKQINADIETKLKEETRLRVKAERDALDVQSRLVESKELMKLCREALKGARGKKELYTRLNLALGCE